MITSDPVRLAAAAYVKRNLTPDMAQRGPLPMTVHDFTDFNNRNYVDTMDPKHIVHSHTALDTFKTCPQQYRAKYITKEVKFEQTTATLLGDRMHKALESRIRDGIMLPTEFAHLEPMVAKVLEFPGIRYVEHKLAFNDNGVPIPYWDKNGYFRGAADLMVFDQEKGYLRIFDWKSGKPRANKDQLDRMALAAYQCIKGVKKIRAAFVYPLLAAPVQAETYHDTDMPRLMQLLQHDIKRVDTAIELNQFPPSPSGLCKQWCDVLSCPFNGRKPSSGESA